MYGPSHIDKFYKTAPETKTPPISGFAEIYIHTYLRNVPLLCVYITLYYVYRVFATNVEICLRMQSKYISNYRSLVRNERVVA